METINNISDLQPILKAWRVDGLRIGFVPTMGNLHQGHLSLVKLAQQHVDRVVVSIFVNPLQFGPNEDFQTYPRTVTADSDLLQKVKTDILFLPQVHEIYPQGMDQQTKVIVPYFSERLCGASRPGHFTGVSTVVTKLLNIVQPEVAVFGQKDFQQLAIIQKMAADLCMPTQVISGPTLREADGLAMSSRNNYLSASERQLAPSIYQSLQTIKNHIVSGNRNYVELCSSAQENLIEQGFKPDYLEICRVNDLLPATPQDNHIVILVAAYLGKTRLIDNIQLRIS